MNMRLHNHMRAGFTIVEMLIVIALIAGLGAILYPYITSQMQKSREGTTKLSLRKVQAQIDLFNADVGQYPETLKDLVRRPTNDELASKWTSPYLKSEKDLNDAWGNKFQYQLTPDQEHPYELFSYGSKGKGAPKTERINVWNL